MRMWNVDPKYMCRKHLLGQHVELHMFKGSITKGKSMKGYIENDLLEPLYIEEYHDMIVKEMESRGMNHKTPLTIRMSDLELLPSEYIVHKIDRKASGIELYRRCKECEHRLIEYSKGKI
jgi:hypothetical protein